MPTPAVHTLVTGFLGFGRFAVNPAALLASGCGRSFELIEVSFAAADAFAESLAGRRFHRLVMMGVAGASEALRLEMRAINRVGRLADVRGRVPDEGMIDPAAPTELAGTLWTPDVVARLTRDERIVVSHDAGDYLCNYVYVRALQRVPDRPVGFLHVPPVEAIELAEQQRLLETVLSVLEGPARASADRAVPTM